MRILVVGVVLLWLTGCAADLRPSLTASASAVASPTPAPAPGQDFTRVSGWRSDLEHLIPAMERLHPDLYHSTSEADVEAAVDRLKTDVPTLADDAVMAGLLGIVASLSADGGDAHTGIYPWSDQSSYPVHSLPLRLWMFPDGVHVIDARPPYEELVGATVQSLGGHSTEEVMAAIDPIAPRDNDQTVRALMPRYLLIPEILRGLGMVDAVDSIDLGLVDVGGASSTVAVEPISMTDYNRWAGTYGLFLTPDEDVLYLSRMDEPLWWTDLGDGTLLVQYNRVEILPESLLADLANAVTAPDVQRVVVDIRHNFGGEVRAVDPIIAALSVPAIDRPDGLFLVTGRNTFSAASLFAARLQERTSVTIVGEAAGGSPNAWGNARAFNLDYSGLSVAVATIFEVATTPDDGRLILEPDMPAPLSFEDWLAKRDPALELILGLE